MEPYAVAKDLLIPLVSPSIAVLTLVVYARQERRKMRVQAELELDKTVQATERDLLSLREAYQLFGLQLKLGQPVEPERLQLIGETGERLMKRFNESPALYDRYFAQARPSIRTERLPLLLHELHVRLRQLPKAKASDSLILFGLYLLLYARAATDPDDEAYKILKLLHDNEPKLLGAWWTP